MNSDGGTRDRFVQKEFCCELRKLLKWGSEQMRVGKEASVTTIRELLQGRGAVCSERQDQHSRPGEK